MVGRVVILIIGAIIISGVLSYTIAIQLEKKSKVQLYGATDEYQDDVVTVSRLEVIKPVVIKSLIIGGIVSIVLAGVSMFFYSHRLAGPVYHLEKHLQDMVEGKYDKKLVFRKKDEFKQLADTINKLQEKLRNKL